MEDEADAVLVQEVARVGGRAWGPRGKGEGGAAGGGVGEEESGGAGEDGVGDVEDASCFLVRKRNF